MISSMFLADTTNVDHAYIDEFGRVMGGSYRPKFIVSGEVDPLEKVVVDFSTIKKNLKSAIDDKETGFDHKLWWYEGISKGDISFSGDTVTISTPHVKIVGPTNIVKVITPVEGFNEYCLNKLQLLYPNINISIDTSLTTDFDLTPQMNTKPHMFRYVHGLKNSTSWGCQNIGHGHLSYIAAKTHNNVLSTDLLLAKIAYELDGAIFAWNDNMQHDDSVIQYDCERGHMYMDVYDNINLIRLPTETTVEYLVEYVYDQYKKELHEAGVEMLFVSEGLSKGACMNLPKL